MSALQQKHTKLEQTFTFMSYMRMRAIQKELGGENPEQAEMALLRERFAKADLPEEVRIRSLGQLFQGSTAAAEHAG
jgi:ATP-dependent Lon protease